MSLSVMLKQLSAGMLVSCEIFFISNGRLPEFIWLASIAEASAVN